MTLVVGGLVTSLALFCLSAGAQGRADGGEASRRSDTPTLATVEPEREPTDLDITVSADADVNPDDKGRPAPIRLRIYELRTGETFQSADYFSLQASEKSLLGHDLLARDEFILRPGETRRIRRKSQPGTSAVGVLAGYRDLGRSEWRAVQPIAPGATATWYRFLMPMHRARLQVQLQSTGVRVTPLP